MTGLLNIGVQALTSNQLALDITGQNIANVNSPGYSRQSVTFDSRAAPSLGVAVTDIGRIVDSFAVKQLWTDTSAASASQNYAYYASQLDDSLADTSTSISAAMDVFFDAMQNGVDDPTSLSGREVVLAEAEALVRRFNNMDSFYQSQNNTIATKISASISNASQLASQIADLNGKVAVATSRGEPANELKDQREEAVRQLSAIMGVSTLSEGPDGNINIFVGNGQPLVLGDRASTLSVTNGDPDPDEFNVQITFSGRSINLNQDITGGEVGGLLTYRAEVMKPAWNELGRLATVFADTMNSQQNQGMDLDNSQGINMFGDLSRSGDVLVYKDNGAVLTATPTVRVTDSSMLKASDYELNFDGPGQFTLIRKSDGEKFNLSDFTLDNSDPANQADMTYFADPVGGSLKLNLDGITIQVDTQSGFTAGDKFLIKPVHNGAQEMSINMTSGRELAFASPVRGETSVDNSGVAEVSDVTITDPTDASFRSNLGALTPPAAIVMNSGTPMTFDVLDMSDPDNPQPYMLNSTTPATALTGLEYTSGEAIQLNGYSVTLSGQAEPGDRFNFDYNTDGISDNRNALKISGLQEEQLVDGSSYQDNYGLLVGRVGTETSVAKLNSEADASVLKNSQSLRDGISGVNLDEEAANIIRFQQAYQASAQLISTSRVLFDTLLGVSGG